MPAKQNRSYGKKKKVLTSSASTRIFSDVPGVIEDDKIKQSLVQGPRSVQVATIDNVKDRHQHADDIARSNVEEELLPAFSTLKLDNVEEDIPDEQKPPVEASPVTVDRLDLLSTLADIQGLSISLQSWTSILPPGAGLSKIAEASFAEVYRVTTQSATSIIKIMPIKHDSDPHSEARTFASTVAEVIPEIQIMNALTEIPGFVTFKSACLLKGRPSSAFVEAWETWGKRNDFVGEDEWEWNSDFEHPLHYGEHAAFLAIELGDAGQVLEEVTVDTVSKVWDIWLGAVIALARAEVMYEFEVG